MPDGDDVVRPYEDVRFAEFDLRRCPLPLGCSQHDEQRPFVNFELRTLVCVVGIFDGEVVQMELTLDLAQESLNAALARVPSGPEPAAAQPRKHKGKRKAEADGGH